MNRTYFIDALSVPQPPWTDASTIDGLRARIALARRMLVLTGAGMSAESGIATRFGSRIDVLRSEHGFLLQG